MTLSNSKVILIGWDGAPHPQISQWMRDGILPNLSKLAERGVFSALESTIHPISPIAWNTIITGQNAGKHGVYDFAQRTAGTYVFDRINSSSRRVPALWDWIGENGGKSGVFNVPATFPPQPVEGFMVSGLLTPTRDSKFTYPEFLAREILQWVPDYRVPGEDAVYVKGKEIEFVDQLIQSVTNQETAVLKLIEKYPDLHFYMFVFMQSDHVHHKLWNYIEENKPGQVLDKIKSLYTRLDTALGKIRACFESQPASFLVVSDHGGGSLDKIVSLNRWLIQKGWMKLKTDPLRGLKRFIYQSKIFPRLYRIVSALGLGRAAKLLPSKFQQKIATSFTSFDDVDWSQTKAYAYGKYGQIYINLKNREPQGSVEASEYDAVCEAIRTALLQFPDPETGRPFIEKVFRREELYSGDHSANAADLIFSMAGYRYDVSIDLGFLDEALFRKPEFDDTGTHRLDGILAAGGNAISAQMTSASPRVHDITPTILSLLECPISPVIDGKPLFDTKKAVYAESSASLSAPRPAQELTEQEKEEIEKRLENLGYLG